MGEDDISQTGRLSSGFEMLSFAIATLKSLLIVPETFLVNAKSNPYMSTSSDDAEVEEASGPVPLLFYLVENVFALVFLLELGYRVYEVRRVVPGGAPMLMWSPLFVADAVAILLIAADMWVLDLIPGLGAEFESVPLVATVAHQVICIRRFLDAVCFELGPPLATRTPVRRRVDKKAPQGALYV